MTGAVGVHLDDPNGARLERNRRLVREVFRRLLRRLREEVSQPRLTQAELARRVGLSREQVVALESGRSALTESSLARLLVAFELELGEFLALAVWTAMELEHPDWIEAAEHGRGLLGFVSQRRRWN